MGLPLFRIAAIALLIISASACNPQQQGFSLPPGNADAGATAFSALGCAQCHSVVGAIEHSPLADDGQLNVVLGGEVRKIATYGDLVTSIIHPTHRLQQPVKARFLDADGKSRMPNFNDRMTVEQMINITTFLQGTYRIVAPEYAPYYIPQR